MNKRNYFNIKAAISLLFLFIIYTIALKHIDVKAIGPNNSVVGFSTINNFFKQLFGVNFFLYNITDWLSLAAIAVAFGFAVLGLIQLIYRKSLLLVDSNILVLGGFYLIVIAVYIFFEFNIINYRPVLINNYLEASYPSSTTMLVMCVMPTAIIQFNKLIKNKRVRIVVNILLVVFTVFIIAGRMISGVHWITDIIGSILLSSSLVILYYSVNQYINRLKDSKTECLKNSLA